jgi:hypothetical protein
MEISTHLHKSEILDKKKKHLKIQGCRNYGECFVSVDGLGSLACSNSELNSETVNLIDCFRAL